MSTNSLEMFCSSKSSQFGSWNHICLFGIFAWKILSQLTVSVLLLLISIVLGGQQKNQYVFDFNFSSKITMRVKVLRKQKHEQYQDKTNKRDNSKLESVNSNNIHLIGTDTYCFYSY